MEWQYPFARRENSMASDLQFMTFVCEQLRAAGAISTRRMFGEYAVYCQDRVVALICDNQLFVKPTDAGRAFIGVPLEVAPFPGARAYFLMSDELDDPDWLGRLIALTAQALPPPKAANTKTPKTLKRRATAGTKTSRKRLKAKRKPADTP
jgi:TfoX/Sxy family transcriptional regulator of competence genes